jgi:hypothetical protein
METFAPYTVLEDSNIKLHLKEPNWRQNLLFFIFRILPILLVMLTVIFINAVTQIQAPAITATIAAMTIPSAILLSIPIMTEVEITPLAVVVFTNNLTGKEEKTIAIADAEKIICKKIRGKHKALLYFLLLKAGGKRQRFLTFHRFYMNDAKREFINTHLQKITKLEVINT